MTQGDGDKPPLLDSAVLERLREDVEHDEGIWKVFVLNFIALLPRRTEKVRATLTSGDMGGALDAVASLHTSSRMVGVLRLAGVADELERALRKAAQQPDPAVVLPGLAAAHLRGITLCAERTSEHLQSHLG